MAPNSAPSARIRRALRQMICQASEDAVIAVLRVYDGRIDEDGSIQRTTKKRAWQGARCACPRSSIYCRRWPDADSDRSCPALTEQPLHERARHGRRVLTSAATSRTASCSGLMLSLVFFSSPGVSCGLGSGG